MTLVNPNNPNMDLNEQQQMIQFAKVLQSSADMECDECHGKNFQPVFRIKKVSGLATGTGRDMIVPVSLYGCTQCGHVNKYFLEKLESGETEETK
jgi:hypothetical protein